jgi:hypothetical protein
LPASRPSGSVAIARGTYLLARPPDEAGEHGVDAVGEEDAPLDVDRFGVDRFGVDRFGVDRFGVDRFGVDRFGVADDGGHLEGGERLEGLAPRDGEGPGLVGAQDAPGAFGDARAGGLCRAQVLTAELRVTDAGDLESHEQLDGDVIGGEPRMGRCGGRLGGRRVQRGEIT